MMVNTFANWAKMTAVSLSNEEGQDLAEYALVLVFIAVVAVAGVTALGGTVSGVFDSINSGLSG